MKNKFFIFTILLSTFFTSILYGTQTIVFVRHGEKPNNDSGVLTCKGLNRSLKLIGVLNKFGVPNAIFAAAPKEQKLGSSLRSIQTISPTAIFYSIPINLKHHAKDITNVKKALLNKEFENSTIFVAWEHSNLVKIVKAIYASQGGNANEIPSWNKNDFDSIYILKIDKTKSKQITFIKESQNLNKVSDKC